MATITKKEEPKTPDAYFKTTLKNLKDVYESIGIDLDKFDSVDEVEEAIDEAQEELEEKIAKKKEKRQIAEKVKELEKIRKLSWILDFKTYDEAIKMAETDEEVKFVEENFK